MRSKDPEKKKDSAPAVAAVADDSLDPRRWASLIVLILANFMTTADVLIVNIGIPTIKADLGATLGQIQFVLATYQLAYAVGLITGGRLGDIFGRKRMFMLGLGVFTVASALCGLAPNPDLLIAARLLQGLSSSVMIPQVLATIQVTFPQTERPKVFAIYGACMGMAGTFGLMMGGALIRLNMFNLSWRPIFLVNVPVGIGALIAAAILVRNSKAPEARKLDLLGCVLMSIGLFLLVYPLVEGRDLGWPAWTFPCLIASMPAIAGFAWYQRRLEAQGGSPLLKLGLFQDKAFVTGLFITVCFFAYFISFFMVLALFLQMGMQLDVMSAALAYAPLGIGFFFGALASAKFAQKHGGRKVLMGGTGVFALGSVLLAVLMNAVDAPSFTLWLAPVLILTGLGQGLVYAPLLNTLLSTIKPSDAGAAAGVFSTVQQIASAVGVAIAGIILFGQLAGHADVVSAELVPAVQQACQGIGLAPAASNLVADGFQVNFRTLEQSKDPGGSWNTPAINASALKSRNPVLMNRLDEAIADLRKVAKRHNFANAFRVTMYAYLLVALALAFLIRRLAKPGAQQVPQPAAQQPPAQQTVVEQAPAPQQSVPEPQPPVERIVPKAAPTAQLPAEPEQWEERADELDELTQQIVLLADESMPESSPASNPASVFDGMLFCTCGCQLVLRQDPQHRYVCPQAVSSEGRLCQMPSVPRQVIERSLLHVLRKGLGTRIEEERRHAEAQSTVLKKELEWLLAKRDRILENYEDGLYGDDAATARATRNAKVEEVEKRRGEIAQEVSVHYQSLRDLMHDLKACETHWEELSFEVQRELLERRAPEGFTVRPDLAVKAIVCQKPVGVRPHTRPLPPLELDEKLLGM